MKSIILMDFMTITQATQFPAWVMAHSIFRARVEGMRDHQELTNNLL